MADVNRLTGNENRETMRHHYRQLLRRVQVDSREIIQLRKDLAERQEAFREGMQELFEICEDKELTVEKRLIIIASALQESMKA